jgi:hypothetical protein
MMVRLKWYSSCLARVPPVPPPKENKRTITTTKSNVYQ